MQRTRVPSSNVVSIGYDEVTSTLEVEYQGGSIYQYLAVPRQVFDALMDTATHGESVGRFMDKNVKKAGFRYQRA